MTYSTPYNPLKVANYFIDLAKEKQAPLSPMKLLKLVYIAHGWHLAVTGEPLLSERIQAWKFGPVITSLYHEFKGYGSGEITGKGVFYESGSRNFEKPTIKPDNEIVPLLTSIWNTYGKLTGGQLSTLTHKEGTPWYRIWHESGGHAQMGALIPDEMIKEHFDELKESRTK